MKKMTKLEIMLEAGRSKLEDRRRVIKEREAAQAAYLADLEEKRLAGILGLVPEFLHQYITVENIHKIHIDMPGCARVSAKVYLHENFWEGKPCFEKAELASWKKGSDCSWSLHRYEAYELVVDLFELPDELFSDLDVALARAVELGDGKASAEAKLKAEMDQLLTLPAYTPNFAEQAARDDAFKELDAATAKELLSEFFARWWREAHAPIQDK